MLVLTRTAPTPSAWPTFRGTPRGRLVVEAWAAGTPYELRTASGQSARWEGRSLPSREVKRYVGGLFPAPWRLRRRKITLDRLISWSAHSDPGVKYFSGTATYTKSLEIPGQSIAKDRRLLARPGQGPNHGSGKTQRQGLGDPLEAPYRLDVTRRRQSRPKRLWKWKVVNLLGQPA